jgi:aminoglycoside 3-N-acetyltransferase
MTAELIPRPPQSILIGCDQLIADLRSLGLCRGQDLLIHSSLRKVGPVDGGPATLLVALRAVAGPEATLVVPTETAQNSLTSRKFFAATTGFDADQLAAYVAAMPGFDPAATPSDGMGAFAEHVRTRPAAHRSNHPQVSFAALGPKAADCTSVHDLNCHLGERSPLGWLYAADAAILLLGVGYDACTAFHLAEYRLPSTRPQTYHCFVAEGERRVERTFTGIVLDDSVFNLLGQAMEAAASHGRTRGLRQGRVGSAPARLIPLRTAVDFADSWLALRRGGDIA